MPEKVGGGKKTWAWSLLHIVTGVLHSDRDLVQPTDQGIQRTPFHSRTRGFLFDRRYVADGI